MTSEKISRNFKKSVISWTFGLCWVDLPYKMFSIFGFCWVVFTNKIFGSFIIPKWLKMEFRNHVESISRTQISLFQSWKCLFFISLIWFQSWKCRWNPPNKIGISKFWCRWNPPPNIRISGAKQFFVHFYVCFCIYIYVSISIG